ncbi:MAG: 3-hydroxyacyl-ACP dehydratase FabZ family protein [Alphaproteobacteria bacterium]
MELEAFRLVDRVVSLSRDERRIVLSAAVPLRSTILDAHFPGFPLMPGVLLIEAMAQASGYLLLALGDAARMPLLAEVREAKMRASVPPGAELAVEAALEHDGSGYAVTRGAIARDGKRVAEAELRLRTVPFPTPELRAGVMAAMQRVGLA